MFLIHRVLQLVAAATFLSGCGVLIGNVKPSDHKAEGYGIAQLDRDSPADWKKLEGPNSASDVDSAASEVPDASYQSKKNSSIISINSNCREGRDTQDLSLHEFTRQLLLGMTDVELNEEKETSLQNIPALQTTLKGKMNREPVMLRSIVLKKKECVYDLMYISRPEHFQIHEPDFTKFIASLRIK